jgi:hypothetical protein
MIKSSGGGLLNSYKRQAKPLEGLQAWWRWDNGFKRSADLNKTTQAELKVL